MIDPAPRHTLCRTVLLAAMATLLWAAPGVAQSVDFTTLYQQAEGFHESVATTQARAKQAAYERDKVLAALLPNIELSGAFNRRRNASISSGKESWTSTVSITQPLFTGGRASSQLKIATIAEAAGNMGVHMSHETLAYDLAQAWFAVLKAEQDLSTETERLDGMRRHLEAARLRVQLGADVRASALRIASEVAGLEAQTLSAEDALATARESLALLTGGDHQVTLGKGPDLSVVSALATPEQYALKDRTDMGLLRGEVKASALGIRYTRGLFLPFIDLEGTYQARSKVNFFSNEDAVLSLRATWNLYNGGEDKAERARARAAHREKQLEAQQLGREIRVQVGQAMRRVSTAKRRVQALGKAQNFAAENHRIVSETYKVGAATYLDVIDASSALGDARRAQINARHDHSLALLELARTTGQLVTLVGQSTPPLDDPKRWLPR